MRPGVSFGAAALAIVSLLTAAESAPRRSSTWVCVTNERSGDLTIVDATARRVVATLPLGKRARGVHASADGRTLYVALSGGAIAAPAERHSPATLAGFPDGRAVEGTDGVGVLDLSRRALTRVLPSGADPEEFAVTADGKRLLIPNAGAGTVSQVRVSDGRVERRARVDGGPVGVSVSPDGRTVLVPCAAQGTVYAIDGRTGEAIERIAVGGRPRAIAFEPDGSCAFVPSETDGKVYVIETASRRVTRTLTLPGGARPMATAMRADGKALYVTTGRGGSVCVIDPVSEKVKSEIRVGGQLMGAALSPDGRTLYVADADAGQLCLIDTRAEKAVGRVGVGKGPWGVSVVPSPANRRR